MRKLELTVASCLTCPMFRHDGLSPGWEDWCIHPGSGGRWTPIEAEAFSDPDARFPTWCKLKEVEKTDEELYRRVALKRRVALEEEGAPVQFLGVYAVHWEEKWGDPEVGFAEV